MKAPPLRRILLLSLATVAVFALVSTAWPELLVVGYEAVAGPLEPADPPAPPELAQAGPRVPPGMPPPPKLVAPKTAIAAPVVAAGYEAPLFATGARDGSGRVFVVEQAGRIYVHPAKALADAARTGKPLGKGALFLDVSGKTRRRGERGLLGLAFHPRFPATPHFFVNYTLATDGTTVVARFSLDDRGRGDADSEVVLLEIEQPASNHNGGMIAFDETGMLVIGTGDGGAANDRFQQSRVRDTLLARLLRIDVDGGEPGGRPYGIPKDNPFVETAGARPEILHTGLRNPWRFSFDRKTHELWIGDVGQNQFEEVHVAKAGARGLDFGWNVMEGNHCFSPRRGCSADGLVPAVYEYSHALGCSITGGYVYRGQAIEGLDGTYLFSDYCKGFVWGLRRGTPGQRTRLLSGLGRVSSFGEDDDGELYVVVHDAGTLRRLVPADAPATPATEAETSPPP